MHNVRINVWDPWNLGVLQTATNCQFNIHGNQTFPSLTNVNGTQLYVDSGVELELAGITQVTNTVGDMIWQVSGAESVLSLPNLEKITNSGTGSNWDIYLRALDGGQLDLSSVTEMVDPNSGNQTARSIQVKADGQDSVVKLNALQSVSDYTAYETGDYNGEYSRLEPVNGGTIETGQFDHGPRVLSHIQCPRHQPSDGNAQRPDQCVGSVELGRLADSDELPIQHPRQSNLSIADDTSTGLNSTSTAAWS